VGPRAVGGDTHLELTQQRLELVGELARQFAGVGAPGAGCGIHLGGQLMDAGGVECAGRALDAMGEKGEGGQLALAVGELAEPDEFVR
jgi:hypothetical protein